MPLQKELVQIFAAVNGLQEMGDSMTVAEGAHFIRKMVNRYFQRNMYPGTCPC